VDPGTAASVRGSVHFEGKRPTSKRISMDAEEICQDLQKSPVYDDLVLVGKEGGLANVFVYIKTGLEGKAFAPAQTAVVLDQRGCQFVPRVVALRAGQTLRVRNSDPVSHNIHPMPQNNRDWNQHQSPQAPDLQRRFAHPEVMIPVKCNVHNWMKSYIGVLDHPYFAVTGPSGEFSLENLPAGQYTLVAWHETLGERSQTVDLPARQSESVTFRFR
jgi:plastocyanin